MKKFTSKEHIMTEILELMRNNENLRMLNLQEIAKELDCTLINICEYFPSYNDLLWDAHAAIHGVFKCMLIEKLAHTDTAELKFVYFFQTIVDIYMDNKGWFRLAWLEYIEGERPQKDIDAVNAGTKFLDNYISDIWNGIFNEYPDKESTGRIMHNMHCYIIGEISNHLLRKGRKKNETELRSYIANESALMFRLCMQGV